MELRVFKKLGVPLVVAEDGQRAVDLVLSDPTRFAFILMDNQMPRLTGEQATRALRAAGYQGVIVGMTGDPRGSPERTEFDSAGLNEVLDKDTLGIERLKEIIAGFAQPAMIDA
mmetsp:Transcript_21147/g.54544  ORF Transcript_21147/g.54544 Transcript_21147/m.54544 type:complete len:114 (-) Transcript_21147:417-758(-)